MKNKSKKSVKALLVCASVLLVAAISVSVTLAYLTASTDAIENNFTAKGDIEGRVEEPNWNEENAQKIAPGKKVEKNPVIDNETSDTHIWVGARVEFTIDIGDTAKKTVDYDTFKKFVDLEGYEPSNSYTSSEKWYEYTGEEVSSAGATTDPKKLYKYYIYLTALDPDQDGTGRGDSDNNVNLSNKDVTKPLFTAVTPKVDIMIDPDSGTATNADLTSSAELSSLTFKKFDFDINVNGYGIKAYKTSDSEDGAVKLDEDLKTEMLKQLIALS